MEGGDGGWRGARNIIILCVFIRMSWKKNLKPNSFVCLPNHSYVFQFMGLDGGTPPEPLLLFRGNNNNESISIHYYYLAEIIIMKRNR